MYDQCYRVAKAAPSEFRQLVSELAGLKGVLKNIRDDVNSERSYVKRLDPDRKESLERLLKSIFASLRKTQQLVVYFKSLGTDEEGLQVWKRTKWLHKRGEILQLRKQITAESTRLGLCMSDINNASLARIEITIEEALNKHDPEFEDDEVAPLMKPRTFSSTHRDSDLMSTSIAIPKRRPTEKTLGEKTLVTNMDYPSSASGDSDPGSPSPVRISRQMSTPTKSHLRNSSIPIGGYGPPSPLTDDGGSYKNRRSSDNKSYIGENHNRGLLIDTRSRMNEYYLTATPDASIVDPEMEFAAAIDIAKEELSRIRQQERQARPLKIPDRTLFPEVVPRAKTEFEQSLKMEIKYRSLNTRDWLRVGTWWLLKAMFRLEALEKSNVTPIPGGLSRAQRSSLSYSQAYVDLLKATWVLFECILKSDYVIPMHSDENRKLFKDLEDVSMHTSRAFTLILTLPRVSVQNTKSFERAFQMTKPLNILISTSKFGSINNPRRNPPSQICLRLTTVAGLQWSLVTLETKMKKKGSCFELLSMQPSEVEQLEYTLEALLTC